VTPTSAERRLESAHIRRRWGTHRLGASFSHTIGAPPLCMAAGPRCAVPCPWLLARQTSSLRSFAACQARTTRARIAPCLVCARSLETPSALFFTNAPAGGTPHHCSHTSHRRPHGYCKCIMAASFTRPSPPAALPVTRAAHIAGTTPRSSLRCRLQSPGAPSRNQSPSPCFKPAACAALA
jgi:hypothetical protein